MKKRDQDSREPASNDPAAVIAHALRRKFAHNVFQDSPGTYMIFLTSKTHTHTHTTFHVNVHSNV